MDEATFNALVEGAEKHYDVNARQVSNGFALAGNVRYVKNGNVVFAATSEAVATTAQAASESLNNFLTTGAF
jgi:hypothetical protein